MIKTRTNAIGLTFQLSSVQDERTSILLVGKGKAIIVDMPIEEVSQCWYNWMNGQFVQTAFSKFTPDEREFIMTGITAEEWAETFKEEEE